MTKIEIILEAEKYMSPDLINGLIKYKGDIISVKEFLETVFIDYLKENASYKSVVTYAERNLKDKIISTNDMPILKQTEENVEKIDNSDIEEKKRRIEEFISTYPNYQARIQTGPKEFLDVTEFLMSKVAFMDDEFMITIGMNKKSISELYENIIMNNVYTAPTLEDKIEICDMYVTECRMLEDMTPVLASTIESEGKSYTLEEYLLTELPKLMNNDFDIVKKGETISVVDYIKKIIGIQKKRLFCINLIEGMEEDLLNSMLDMGNGKKIKTVEYITDRLPQFLTDDLSAFRFGHEDYPIDETINSIVKKQRKVLEAEKKKADEEHLAEVNRFPENPSLVPTIEYKVKDDAEEITVELPALDANKLDGIAQTHQEPLTREEMTMLFSVNDYSLIGDNEFFMNDLNNMSDATTNSRTIHDLETTENLLKKLIDSLNKQLINQQIESYKSLASSNIETKRQYLIKIENNKEEYSGTMLDELRSIVEKIDRVHSVEEYSTILCTLTRIKRDVLSKRIKSEEIDSLLKEIQKKMPLAGMKSEIFYGMEEQKGIAI